MSLTPQCQESAIFILLMMLLTKFHSLDGLNNINLFARNFGGWKSEIKVAANLVSEGLSGLSRQSHLYPHWSFLNVGV